MIYIQAKCETYAIDEHGNIGRPKINMQPSGQWKLRGLERLNNFGRRAEFVPFKEIESLVGRDLLCKNGEPQWFMADLDHDTMRTMMEGVIRVYKGE